METRQLGNSGIEIPPFGIGCNRLTDSSDPGLFATVDEALSRGVTHFDSAESYGDGKSEEFLAAALKGRRDRAFIASKFGMRYVGGKTVICGTPEYLRAACDLSLGRLRTDRIDLYYQHRVDPNVPVEETWGAMKELVDAGKVRSLGISNPTVDEIRRAHAVHPVSALQMEYSLFTRRVEDEFLPLCAELGITFVAYGPLAFALLSGEITSKEDFPETDRYRRNMPRFQDENIGHNLELLRTLREVAGEIGGTPGQTALKWLMDNPVHVVPIPGSRRREHLIENAGACGLELTAEQYRRLSDAYPPGAAKGDNRPQRGATWAG